MRSFFLLAALLSFRALAEEPQVVALIKQGDSEERQGHSRARMFVLDGEQALGSGVSLVNAEGVQQVLITALPDGTGVIRAGGETLVPSAKSKAVGKPGPLPK